MGAGERGAFVESHDDIGAEGTLDGDRFLRAEEKFRAVDMRGEFDAVRFHLAQRREAENLEAAAVGKDRAVPVHEAVQTAGLGHDFHARLEKQMIGVAEDDLGVELDQFGR